MADRTIFEFNQSRLRPASPVADYSAANLLNMVSNSLSKAGEDQLKQWQEATVRQSTEAGRLAGSQGTPKYQKPGTLSADAFNEAATKSYITNLETNASAKMAALQEQYKNDPEGYQKESTNYITGLTDELKKSKQTAHLAGLFDARLRLSQQSAGYTISKNYMAVQSQKIKAENEDLYQTIKNNTYREAGTLFSKDPMEQGVTLEKFALNKKILDQTLHAVLPDGTPVYSPAEVASRQKEFHKKFYTRAVQDYVSENNIPMSDLQKIKDGTFSVDIPGLGKINILDEVGDDYERKVRDWTFTKIREKNAAEAKAQVQEKALAVESQKVNGVEMLAAIQTGQPITTSQVLEDVRNGKINSVDAKAAVKLITDPTAGTDDAELVADLTVKSILGQDIGAEIRMNANRMKGTTFIRLMEDNAKNKVGVDDENKKWLVKETVQKDQFGIEDPKTLRFAKDIIDRYDKLLENGMSPELAFEKSREAVDIVKDRTNRRLYNSIPKFMVIKGNAIDINATFKATKEARMNGLLNDDEFNIEISRLRAIKNERKGVNGQL